MEEAATVVGRVEEMVVAGRVVGRVAAEMAVEMAEVGWVVERGPQLHLSGATVVHITCVSQESMSMGAVKVTGAKCGSVSKE
jgi:hypothetical protein